MIYFFVGNFLKVYVVGIIFINYIEFFEKVGLELVEVIVKINYI